MTFVVNWRLQMTSSSLVWSAYRWSRCCYHCEDSEMPAAFFSAAVSLWEICTLPLTATLTKWDHFGLLCSYYYNFPPSTDWFVFSWNRHDKYTRLEQFSILKNQVIYQGCVRFWDLLSGEQYKSVCECMGKINVQCSTVHHLNTVNTDTVMHIKHPNSKTTTSFGESWLHQLISAFLIVFFFFFRGSTSLQGRSRV